MGSSKAVAVRLKPLAAPKPVETPKRPRIQAELSERSYNRLVELQEIVGAESLREVFRDALKVYDWYITRTRIEGHTLKLTSKNGGETFTVDLGV